MIEDKRKEIKEKIIEFMERNPFYKYACMFAGISIQTLENWRTEDIDFATKLEARRSQTLTKYINKSAPEFVLTHADPEMFNIAKKIDAKIDGNVNINVINYGDNNTPTQLPSEAVSATASKSDR